VHRKQHCAIVKDLLSACKLLEEGLNSVESSAMSRLGPSFCLVGSVSEGAKVGCIPEVDIAVTFEGLRNHPFKVGDKATSLEAPGVDSMRDFTLDDAATFDYPKFLNKFLDEVRNACVRMECPGSLKLGNPFFVPCPDCKNLKKNISLYEPVTHCSHCRPAVIHTKLGACLIFQWDDGSLKDPIVVTVDLVPTFPVVLINSDPLELYNKVVKTLVQDRPPLWLNYFNSLMSRDIFLPEALSAMDKSDSSLVAIKLLNYGPESNYVIRPCQEMRVENFQDSPKLKEIYQHMKALKEILSVDVKSYFLKKVSLLPEFKTKARVPEASTMELLYDVLSYPDLKRRFAKQIDYERWSQGVLSKDCWRIPLARSVQYHDRRHHTFC
jgi:hypothetical protein